MDFAAEIDKVTIHFQSQFKSLEMADMQLKPSPDQWSIAEVIAHLIQVTDSYRETFEAIRNAKYNAPWLGKIGFLRNAMGNMILKSVLPTTKRKIKTFPIWEPKASLADPAVLDNFAQHQEYLKDFIHFAKGAKLLETPISSPANKNIVYTLGLAFEIIIRHQERHLEQAMDIHEQLKENQA